MGKVFMSNSRSWCLDLCLELERSVEIRIEQSNGPSHKTGRCQAIAMYWQEPSVMPLSHQ